MNKLSYTVPAAVLLLPIAAQSAPSGCGSPVMRGPGAMSYLNSKVGQPDGPPRRVVAIEEVQQDRVFGGFSGNVLQCHETLIFGAGIKQSGVVTFTMSSSKAPLNVTWLPDRSADQYRRQYFQGLGLYHAGPAS